VYEVYDVLIMNIEHQTEEICDTVSDLSVTVGAEMYRAELRRTRKDGTGWDVVPCMFWPTQKEAWAACVSRALTMVSLCENGRRDLAEGFFDK
jgi:hypothetical protein